MPPTPSARPQWFLLFDRTARHRDELLEAVAISHQVWESHPDAILRAAHTLREAADWAAGAVVVEDATDFALISELASLSVRPLFAVFAEATDPRLSDALRAGATLALAPPFRPERLKKLLDSAVPPPLGPKSPPPNADPGPPPRGDIARSSSPAPPVQPSLDDLDLAARLAAMGIALLMDVERARSLPNAESRRQSLLAARYDAEERLRQLKPLDPM